LANETVISAYCSVSGGAEHPHRIRLPGWIYKIAGARQTVKCSASSLRRHSNNLTCGWHIQTVM
jgi:hypothetical protein